MLDESGEVPWYGGLAALIGDVRHSLEDTFCLINKVKHPQEIYISWIDQISSISTLYFLVQTKNCYVSCNNLLMTLGYVKAFTNKTYLHTETEHLLWKVEDLVKYYILHTYPNWP